MKKIPFQEQPEKERNRKIYEFYETGSYNMRALSRIFKISTARIHQIISKEREEVNKRGETKTIS